MSKSGDCELLVDAGRKQEERYEWIAALGPYGKAVTAALELKNSFKAAEIHERIGYCCHQAAMQAENVQEFKNRMLQAVRAYNRAGKLFEKAVSQDNQAKTRHCQAIAAYVGSWLEPDCSSQKRSLEKCLKLEKEALGFYEKSLDRLNLGKACNELNTHLLDTLNLEWDTQKRKEMLKEALSYGERAIAVLSELREEHELARAYCTTSNLYNAGEFVLEPTKRGENKQRAVDYSTKAMELSEKIGDRYLLSLSNISLGYAVTLFPDRQDSAAKYFENALHYSIDTRDHYLIGLASYGLASSASWKMFVEEDPETIREESKRCEKYSEDAIYHFSSISHAQWIASSYCWYAENYNILAQSVETDPEEKRLLLKRSVETGRKGLEHARRSGSISATWLILHPLSKSLFFLSTMETDPDTKKRLLEESLRYRKENIKTLKQAVPYYYWNQGVRAHYLALIQAELAEIDADREHKVKLLAEATKSAEDCINLCLRHGTLSQEQCAALGGYYYDSGAILDKLHQLTRAHVLLDKLKEVAMGAVETYEKADLPSRAAEGYWQLANAHNKLRSYAEAAESFEAASASYKTAAGKLPQLEGFYSEYAAYMKAWSAIERAKHSHMTEEYSQSKTYYETAADICKTLKLWSCIAPNFSAWASLEHGEHLSREENSREAVEAFQQAAKLFDVAKESLKKAALRVDSDSERKQALALIDASETRREYCRGRTLLEEARIHDRRGDTLLSAEKYSLATKVFEKVAEAFEQESERRELYRIIYSCQAWEKMKLAEHRVNPALFMESSKLFDKAKEHSDEEKASLLAMGNSALCKALEAGARFEATRDIMLYSTAKQNMESAANYYLKAGFENASTWVNANQSLLDAYVHVGKAESATITEEKVRQYQLAERYLERSAKFYEKAGYTGKIDEVIRILSRVREKREFAISLTKVIKPPTVASSPTLLSVPAYTQEEAVGLERFDHVNVQAHVSAPEEVAVEEEFELRIDLVNVARVSGLLARIEDLIPTTFKMTKVPAPYIIEDKSLNAQGKKLAPDKVESIRISAQATKTGVFRLCPEVVYVDELGKFKRCKCDAIPITILSPAGFQFGTENARKVFEYLTKSFITDYMMRRLALEKSGWRTFVQIKEDGKVPKSSLYGTSKHRGYAVSELERRGLVETRIFPGERGRGGKILRTRISYEKETVKRYIDRRVMKNEEKSI